MATILHTTTYGVGSGLYNIEKQKNDSPTFSELLGSSSYFLHIPGTNASKGQKRIYHLIRELIENEKLIDLYSLYNLQEHNNLHHQFFIKNTD